jgi:hypothetical protein
VQRGGARLLGVLMTLCMRVHALQVQWIGRNVLSVHDFEWAKDGYMHLTEVETAVVDALRGEVSVNRMEAR